MPIPGCCPNSLTACNRSRRPGLNPIETVTELRAAHAATPGSGAGVNVRRGRVTDMRQEHVLQPLHVTASALALATETVRAILKIDDIVSIVI